MTEYSPSTHASQETFSAELPPIVGTVNIRLRPEHFVGTAWPPDPGPDGNVGTAYLSPTELSRHNGHAVEAYDPRAAFEWPYQEETGAPLFHSVRTREKKFWQSPADGKGGWVKPSPACMDGVRLVPLYLPEVLVAIRNSGLILIPEGERKVDLLRHWGFVATCNVSGAIRSKLWFDHAKEFFSAVCYSPRIIVLPDNDNAGRKHADTIGAAFAAVGVTVHILELNLPNGEPMPPKGDVAFACGKLTSLYGERTHFVMAGLVVAGLVLALVAAALKRRIEA